MKLVPIKCPNCNADLDIDPTREFCFCQHCGTKLLIETSDAVAKARIDYQAMKDRHELEKYKLELETRRKESERKDIVKGERMEFFTYVALFVLPLILALIWAIIVRLTP